MKITRLLVLTAASGVLVASGCGGTDDSPDAGSTSTSVVAATTTGPTSESTTTDAGATPQPSDAWADQLLTALDTYDAARADLDRQVGERMGSLEEPTEQQFFEVLADQMAGWADAGDELTAALPTEVPVEIEPALDSMVEAHVELVAGLRAADAALRDGDPGPYEDLGSGLVATFSSACADLQFVVLDLGAGLIACGIDGEDPDVPDFVSGPTVDDSNDSGDSAPFVDMPAGSHQLDYVGPAGFDPFVSIGLDYDTDLVIRTSLELVELGVTPDGPTMRIHANELVANPTQLGATEIPDSWRLAVGLEGDPTAWIGSLEGVRVTSTGTGLIGGFDARSWDLVSERDEPIAVLGDGAGWLPETTLDPDQPVRLWSLLVDDHPLLITLHPPDGADLEAFADDFDLLLGGLTFSAT